jgi:hypothetical protein
MTRDFIDKDATYTVPKSCCLDQSSFECERVSFSDGVRGEDQSRVLFQEVRLLAAVPHWRSPLYLNEFNSFLFLVCVLIGMR